MSANKPATGNMESPSCVVDLEPVDLDPPDPALARWQELAEREHGVDHDGNAEHVMPFPRPAWAEPESDYVGLSSYSSCYNSEWVDVVASRVNGACDDETWWPASVRVRAKLHGDGLASVGVRQRRSADNEWSTDPGMSLTPAEALELADVLRAAVDLIGGAR